MEKANNAPYAVVLGTVQDAGYPSAGCGRECCAPAWEDPSLRRYVSCLGLVDPAAKQRFLVDCTPDFRDQLRLLDRHSPEELRACPHGILLTHAHVGHYAGLIHLGREVLDTSSLPLYVMPRMEDFLKENAPWEMLLSQGNVTLNRMERSIRFHLTENIEITAFVVPHRDEYTETVCFRIDGPARPVLWMPDIDRLDGSSPTIEDLIRGVKVAYIDGTFYDEDELEGRDMSEVPHPSVSKTMHRLSWMAPAERAKVRFIHFNHTNPLLKPASEAAEKVRELGFGIAEQGEIVAL